MVNLICNMVFTNRTQAFLSLFVIALLGSITFSSCNSDEGLPTYDNPNISDTSGKNINLDLFISLEIDGEPLTFFNGQLDYTNQISSGQDGFCGGGTDRFLQVHSTNYVKPESKRYTFYIDVMGCLSSDSLVPESRIDSVLVVGRYPYLPTFTEQRAVVIRYVDGDENLWSTTFGPNNTTASMFELSALIDNGNDVFSKKIAFGRFEGILYDGAGNSLTMKSGQFKGRIVQ